MIPGGIVSVEGPCWGKVCVGGGIVSAEGLCWLRNCVGGGTVSAEGLCRRKDCVVGRTVSADCFERVSSKGGGRMAKTSETGSSSNRRAVGPMFT